jgi:hypothetical protein
MSGTIGDRPQPHASKFKVILDSPISLKVGGDIDRTFDFDLYSNVWHDFSAIISFFLVESTNLQLQVTNDLQFWRLVPSYRGSRGS